MRSAETKYNACIPFPLLNIFLLSTTITRVLLIGFDSTVTSGLPRNLLFCGDQLEELRFQAHNILQSLPIS